MRYVVAALFALALSMMAGAPAADAQMVDPKIGTVTPFTAAANFMSLPGYLRYLIHEQSGQWLTYGEAARAVRQQTGQ